MVNVKSESIYDLRQNIERSPTIERLDNNKQGLSKSMNVNQPKRVEKRFNSTLSKPLKKQNKETVKTAKF